MSVTTHYDDDVGEFPTVFCFFVCVVTRQYPPKTLHRGLEKTDHGTMWYYVCIHYNGKEKGMAGEKTLPVLKYREHRKCGSISSFQCKR